MTTGEPSPTPGRPRAHVCCAQNHTRTTIMPDAAQRAMDLEMEGVQSQGNTFVTRPLAC
jgi:hypothetical protein